MHSVHIYHNTMHHACVPWRLVMTQTSCSMLALSTLLCWTQSLLSSSMCNKPCTLLIVCRPLPASSARPCRASSRRSSHSARQTGLYRPTRQASQKERAPRQRPLKRTGGRPQQDEGRQVPPGVYSLHAVWMAAQGRPPPQQPSLRSL